MSIDTIRLPCQKKSSTEHDRRRSKCTRIEKKWMNPMIKGPVYCSNYVRATEPLFTNWLFQETIMNTFSNNYACLITRNANAETVPIGQ